MYFGWYVIDNRGRLQDLPVTHAHNSEQRSASIWGWLKERCSEWQERQLFRQQLESMSAAELSDISLSRGDIAQVVKAYPRAGRLHRRMLDRLGIDYESAMRNRAGDMRALARDCVSCKAWKRCKTWLDSGSPGDEYRSFCPNAAQLATCKTHQDRMSARASLH